jgi:large subunit ribosomal protein L4
MSEIDIRSITGDVVGKATLDDALFGAQVNVPAMHQVVRAQLAAARAGTRATKRRGEVRGGGAKPWRQKGTGRARQGSNRAPHWSGGGVVFGPQPRDFSMKVNRKLKVVALRSALTDRAREGRIAVVDRFAFDGPKTADAVKVLDALGVKGKSLVVIENVDMTVGKSFRNLSKAHVITVDQLNTYDILDADWLVFTQKALELVGKPKATEAAGGEAE